MRERTSMRPPPSRRDRWLVWLAWFVLLVALLGWQWQRRRALLDALPSQPIESSVQERHARVRRSLREGHRWVAHAESVLLAPEADALLTWLTLQAEAASVRITRTAHEAGRTESVYRLTPFEVELVGDFASLTRLLHRFERAHPHVPLGGVRMFTHASGPPVLQLTFHLLSHPDEAEHPAIAWDGAPSSLWESDFDYPDQAAFRNPFTLEGEPSPPMVQATTPSSLPTLTAILWDATQPVAILEMPNPSGGQPQSVMLRVRERIGTYQVVAIERGSVTLRRAGKDHRFLLWSCADETASIQVR